MNHYLIKPGFKRQRYCGRKLSNFGATTGFPMFWQFHFKYLSRFMSGLTTKQSIINVCIVVMNIFYVDNKVLNIVFMDLIF